MSTTFLPQARGPDHDGAQCEQASSAGSALTWGIHSHGQTAFVILSGELDIATAPGLAQRLAPLADTGKHLLLDLAGLRFCDCAGLSVFLRLRQRVMSAGGSLRLTAPTGAIRRLLVLTGQHDLLSIAAGPVEVIRTLGCDVVTAPPLPPADDTDIVYPQAGAVPAVTVAS